MVAAAFCIVAMCGATRAQLPILYYDFENNTTRTTFENLVEQAVNSGSGAITRAGGSTTVSLVAGAGSFNGGAAAGQAATGTSWDSSTSDPGSAATNYYQFVVNTTGFSQLSITFDQQASAAGPARVGVLYSTNGSTFTASTPILTGNAAFGASIFDLSGITAIDNQSAVTIRLYAFAGSAGDRTGRGAFASGGTFRIDNLTVLARTATASNTLLNYPAIGLSIKSGIVFTPTYVDFTVNGAGITVVLASALQVSGTFTVSNGTLNCGAFVLSGTGSFTLNSGGTLGVGDVNGITTPACGTGATCGNIRTTTRTYNVLASYIYNSTADQETGNGMNVPLNLTISTNGTTTVSAGLVSISADGDFTISSGSTFNVGNKNFSYGGSNWTNNGTYAPGGLSQSVAFTGAGAVAIKGTQPTTFARLVINNSGAGTTTMTTSCSVSDALRLDRDLIVVSAAVLSQTGSSDPLSTKDVIGTVRRADLGGATQRDFGNPNVEITIVSGDITAMDVTLQKGAPGGFAGAVQRYYALEPVNGTVVNDATVKLHYLDSELQSNDAATLSLWRAVGSPSGTWTDQGPAGITRTTGADPNNWVRKTGVIGFSAWTLAAAPATPTAVKLADFTATQDNGEVKLQWRTGYEVHNLGYNIYREENGKRVAVTPSLVAGSALLAGGQTSLTAGASYTWYDQLPGDSRQTAGGSRQTADNQLGAVRYWLEDVDLSGTRTLHGPIVPQVVFALPAQGGKALRADLISEIGQKGAASLSPASRRSQVTGVEISRWPAAFRPQLAKERKRVSDPDAAAVQRQIEAQPGIRIAVNKEGWYRITQPELLAAGLDPNTNAPQLQLYASGRAIPIKQSGDGVHLTDSDYIEFYGQGVESPTDTGQTYYLVVDPNHFGTRIGDLSYRHPSSLPPPSGATSFDYTVERRERMIYFSGLRNGEAENFFGHLVSTMPSAETLPVINAAATSTGTLEVVLQGVTSQSHLVQVVFNGAELGTINFANREHPSQTFDIPAAALQSGNNTVQLKSLGGDTDVSLVDTLRLTYAHNYAADNNALAISVASEEVKRVAGFSSNNIRVVDITDAARVLELTETARVNTEADGTYSVDLQVQRATFRRPHTLLVFADSTAAPAVSVRPNEPSSWWSQTAGADYVIVTTRELLANVAPLAQLHRNQGLVVQVIDVEDLYDEFSYGQHTPQAIHDLLVSATSSWTRKPHYVLLAGDASYDPKNYFGQGINDLVPTKLIDTALMEAGSDDWLADFNGDGLADLALGRLPVRTAAELDTMVNKIVSYENTAPDPSRGALLVADTSFEAPSSAVGSLLPAGMPVQTVNRGSLDDATAHTQIIAGLNQGPRVANYFGHGSNGVWTGAALLSSDDAPGLTNSNRLSVFTMMTCFNGFFQDAWNDSLSEALLKTPGGAVAVWASTSLTDPSGQKVIALEFYRQLFGAQPATLGDASRAAKLTTTDADVRRTWILFGDPAMRLR